MGLFPLAVFTLFLFTGIGFALRIDLEAPASYVIAVSSVQSSTSPIFTNNAHVVIQYVKMNETDESDTYNTDTGTCPANMAAYNNKAISEVSAYNNSRRISHVINLKIKSTSLNHCNEVITVVDRHIVLCNKKNEQQVFNWSVWLAIFFLIFFVGLINYSVRYFNGLRPLFHDYFDHNELERQHGENVAADE